MAFETIRGLVGIHPVLKEYRDALISLGIEPIRHPLKERLFNRNLTAFAKLDSTHRERGKIAISSHDPMPRESLIHEAAHILLDHLLGDEKQHEMEAGLVAYYAARRLGWEREAASSARYAKRYASDIQALDDAAQLGLEVVTSAYSPEGETQQRIQQVTDRIVAAFRNVKKG
jgi:hypothetical protein